MATRSPASRSRIDETADKFERILDVIIEYADIETRLKRLGEEIQKTNRRVNALEQITVPALKEQVAYIQMTLDERAREDLFRLKKVKKKIEKKKAAADGVTLPPDARTSHTLAYRGRRRILGGRRRPRLSRASRRLRRT